MNKSETFMTLFDSETDYVKMRLQQLSLNLNFNIGFFNMRPRGGFTRKFDETRQVLIGPNSPATSCLTCSGCSTLARTMPLEHEVADSYLAFFSLSINSVMFLEQVPLRDATFMIFLAKKNGYLCS